MIYDLQILRNVIETHPSLDGPVNWDSPGWAIFMGFEHERIHIETSSVLIREVRGHLKTAAWRLPFRSRGFGVGAWRSPSATRNSAVAQWRVVGSVICIAVLLSCFSWEQPGDVS